MAASSNDMDAPKTAPDSMLGATLNGRYRVRSVIANGGMGRIYLAEQIPLGRLVAVKVLHGRYTTKGDDPAFQKRFFLEASILSRLQHPNIVTLYDYGRIDGLADESYFMAMEYLGGETLHRRLRMRGALTPGEATALIRSVARGLREAHRQGVVHRDLKPSNVMLVPGEDGSEVTKILDFGLVKVLSDDSEELTKEGSFLGSPRYMSPEQIAHGRVDLRTDVYSLGVILYQCLCGRTPFESENSVHILMAHLHTAPPPMRERAPGVEVPERLERFALRCMEKDPAQRPATMDDVLRELAECEAAVGIVPVGVTTGSFVHSSLALSHPPADIAPVDPSQPSPSRPGAAPSQPPPRRVLPVALVAATLLLVGLGASIALRRKAPEAPPVAPSAPAPFTLVIDSAPSGVTVFEGGVAIGRTPLALTVESASVAAAPRDFELRAPGHERATLSVGPSTQRELRRFVELTPLPAPAPAARPDSGTGAVIASPHAPEPVRPARPPRRPPPTSRPAAPPDDIRSHR
jgi:serine/threonine-protein kinase